MNLSLDGKTAVVTGAARGIGKAVALLFAQHGAKVVVADRLGDLAQQVATEVESGGGQAAAAAVDIVQEADVKAMFDLARERFGGVDLLVHSAAIFPKYEFLQMTVEQWDAIQAVNLHGSFLVLREALRAMVEQGRGGAIVNISSVSGERAAVHHNAAYGASKAGLTNLTRVTALEFAKHKIRVNAVLPGGTTTEGAREAVADMNTRGLSTTGPMTGPGRVPLGAMGAPADIANACLFLASDAARAITGQMLAVDGGFLVS